MSPARVLVAAMLGLSPDIAPSTPSACGRGRIGSAPASRRAPYCRGSLYAGGRLRCLLLVLLAAGLAAPAGASATGSISGHVADQNGSALPNICVWASDSNFVTVGSGQTGGGGDYLLTGVPAGNG